MRFPWANTFLLLALILQGVTGYFGFTSGRENERWLLWLHGIGAFTILLVLFWKGAIVLNRYRNTKGWDIRRSAFAIMAVLLLLTLISGLLWTFFGPLYLMGFSAVTLHIFLAVALISLSVWHLLSFRWILKVPAARDRRAFLRSGVMAMAGLATWQGANLVRKGFALPGRRRRFTGSYETGSFSGNFPRVSWINDDPQPLNIAEWRLQISGAVARPLSLSHAELLAIAPVDEDVILDCTGGWYSAQSWSGIPFGAILEMVKPETRARSVTFESVTGYSRRFGLQESKNFLLATHVAGAPLSHGHGYPLRLVIPGRRGVYWVKWLASIRLNTSGRVWQSPLPLE